MRRTIKAGRKRRGTTALLFDSTKAAAAAAAAWGTCIMKKCIGDREEGKAAACIGSGECVPMGCFHCCWKFLFGGQPKCSVPRKDGKLTASHWATTLGASARSMENLQALGDCSKWEVYTWLVTWLMEERVCLALELMLELPPMAPFNWSTEREREIVVKSNGEWNNDTLRRIAAPYTFAIMQKL